jgi:hypothetical protein
MSGPRSTSDDGWLIQGTSSMSKDDWGTMRQRNETVDDPSDWDAVLGATRLVVEAIA